MVATVITGDQNVFYEIIRITCRTELHLYYLLTINRYINNFITIKLINNMIILIKKLYTALFDRILFEQEIQNICGNNLYS